jgi:hypothetical protein
MMNSEEAWSIMVSCFLELMLEIFSHGYESNDKKRRYLDGRKKIK